MAQTYLKLYLLISGILLGINCISLLFRSSATTDMLWTISFVWIAGGYGVYLFLSAIFPDDDK